MFLLFVILFAVALILVLLVEGYASYLGNSDPLGWIVRLGIAALVAAVITGLVDFVMEVAGLLGALS